MSKSKKRLFMIGNSHIDPVWFWQWQEGLQEVKATFSSALDRMKEYPEFYFTSTSSAFYRWIEKILPSMFDEIKKRVDEGRWEIVGGWAVEPDCNLPSGESFVRQALYSQRYFKEKFGKIVKIGFNIDSFGHNSMLPQILKKSGIDYYIFMRPHKDCIPPIFNWVSPDGSSVVTCNLPGEYTTWFKDATVENINNTLEKMYNLDEMVCFYGVGNHGGGPTKENIETIKGLIGDFDGAELKFSTLQTFFDRVDKKPLNIVKDEMEGVNEGCYSVDSKIKAMNRRAENSVIRAERMNALFCMSSEKSCSVKHEIENVWNVINFNQFHDTLCGTAIREARDEAIMQLSGAISKSRWIENLAVQNLINSIDTRGEGFPLILINTEGYEYDGYAEVEFNWFCKDPLSVFDSFGNEVPYQRIKTSCTMVNRHIGGRRRIILKVKVPAYGYTVLRLDKKEPAFSVDVMKSTCDHELENKCIKAKFSPETGELIGLTDKSTNYNMLCGPVENRVYTDERDTWGGGPGEYGFNGEKFTIQSIKKIEAGIYRSAIKVISTYGKSQLEQIFYLYRDLDYVVVKNYLLWNEEHKMLKMSCPFSIGEPAVRAEIPYGFIDRHNDGGEENFMHRWADIYDSKNNYGGIIVNDCKYGYSIEKNVFDFTVVRSAIYAQGTCEGWYNENDVYRFTDQGEHDYSMIIKPHGSGIKNSEAIRLSNNLNSGLIYISDTNHNGNIKDSCRSFINIDKDNIMLSVVKECEDDDGYVLRLYETEGCSTEVVVKLAYLDVKMNLKFNPCEIKTVYVSKTGFREVNMLEFGGF